MPPVSVSMTELVIVKIPSRASLGQPRAYPCVGPRNRPSGPAAARASSRPRAPRGREWAMQTSVEGMSLNFEFRSDVAAVRANSWSVGERGDGGQSPKGAAPLDQCQVTPRGECIPLQPGGPSQDPGAGAL